MGKVHGPVVDAEADRLAQTPGYHRVRCEQALRKTRGNVIETEESLAAYKLRDPDTLNTRAMKIWFAAFIQEQPEGLQDALRTCEPLYPGLRQNIPQFLGPLRFGRAEAANLPPTGVLTG
jgi:hypothetical protein